jgi:hypothetical protein
VLDYVHGHPDLVGMTEQQWAQVHAFSTDLVEHSPPFKPYLGVEPARWIDRREIAEADQERFVDATDVVRSVHPIRPHNIEDAEQLAAYVIYHASFYHGWCNDAQLEDGGDVQFACFGLRTREMPADNAAWDDAKWRAIAPEVPDAALQLFVAETLSKTRYGYVVARADQVEEGQNDATPQRLLEALNRHANEFPAEVDIREIRSMINI